MKLSQYPLSHEGLLIFAIRWRASGIHEFEGDGRFECRKLKRWALRYAGIHDLKIPNDDELFGIYYEDEEQDAEIAQRIDAEEAREECK